MPKSTEYYIETIMRNLIVGDESDAQHSEVFTKHCAMRFEPFIARTEWGYFAKFCNEKMDDTMLMVGSGSTVAAAMQDLIRRMIAVGVLKAEAMQGV
ncbi:hypothetical protein ACXWTF_12630 [Thiomicrolovo sp. ZZH C-3]